MDAMDFKKAKIIELKEFGCNIDNYNPYAYGEIPKFRKEKSKWF